MTKTTNRCTMCRKELATSSCAGCGICLCTQDFKIHREILSGEMSTIVAHRKSLLDRVNKVVQQNDSQSSLIVQIDQWQEMMIAKVKTIAEHTRQQVVQLLNSKRMKFMDDFERFSEELTTLKDTQNFVESDLRRLKQKIREFKYQLKHTAKPVTVDLHTELSEQLVWNQLIYAEERITHTGTQQCQRQGKEKPQPIPASPQKQLPEI